MKRLSTEEKQILYRVLARTSKMQDDIINRLKEDRQAQIEYLKNPKYKKNENLANNRKTKQ